MHVCRIAKADDSKGEAVVKYNVYEAPEWADPPPDTEGVSLDILKTGTILDTIELPQKSFLTLGRNKEADIIAEHPSTSRLHAVLQFQDCAAYLVDCGSTHGTSLNHKQLTPFLYHRVHVGAQFTLGQSTRSYVFNAPEVRLYFLPGDLQLWFFVPEFNHRVDHSSAQSFSSESSCKL